MQMRAVRVALSPDGQTAEADQRRWLRPGVAGSDPVSPLKWRLGGRRCSAHVAIARAETVRLFLPGLDPDNLNEKDRFWSALPKKPKTEDYAIRRLSFPK